MYFLNIFVFFGAFPTTFIQRYEPLVLDFEVKNHANCFFTGLVMRLNSLYFSNPAS